MSQSRLSERLDEMKDEILEGIQKSVQIDSGSNGSRGECALRPRTKSGPGLCPAPGRGTGISYRQCR